jgi:hypothetical protein
MGCIPIIKVFRGLSSNFVLIMTLFFDEVMTGFRLARGGVQELLAWMLISFVSEK